MTQTPEDARGRIRRQGIANEFLAAWLADRDRGQERSLGEYQAMFPGHEELVAEEFAALVAGEGSLPTIADEPSDVPDVTIEGLLGRGGQGTVYRGRQTYLDRPVAVKVLSPDARGVSFVQAVRTRGAYSRRPAPSQHRHLLQAGTTTTGGCYLVMELVEGPNLARWLEENGPLPTVPALSLCRDLAAALDHAVRHGIVHRDVKSENVLLQSDPEGPEERFPYRCKLADLGLARPMFKGREDSMLTASGALVGTPSTMAPEQFDAPEAVDHRADVYGVGCVLYHVLGGRPPFPPGSLTETLARKTARFGPDVREANPRVPEAVAELVSRMLARDPSERPQSHADVMQRCDALLAAQRGGRRHLGGRLALAAAAAVVLLMVLQPWARSAAPPALAGIAVVEALREGRIAVLEARAEDPEGRPMAYRWRQTAGPPVEMEDPEA